MNSVIKVIKLKKTFLLLVGSGIVLLAGIFSSRDKFTNVIYQSDLISPAHADIPPAASSGTGSNGDGGGDCGDGGGDCGG